MTSIQSVGLPPARHADRVVAELMRHITRQRASLWNAIQDAFARSSDGTPRAQRKLEKRVLRAGATYTQLTPGKRGRYSLDFSFCTGWDPFRDEEIGPDSVMPARPWIAYQIGTVQSAGGGRREIELRTTPFLFVTHHCLSRTAQRYGARTAEHLMDMTNLIMDAAIEKVGMEVKAAMDVDKALSTPAAGWRVKLATDDGATVVLRRHEQRRALVAATVL